MIFIFVSVLSLGQFLYLRFRKELWPLWTINLNAKVSSFIINILTPSENITAKGDCLVSGSRAVIQIKPGCDGIDAILILWAAFAACPGITPAKRVSGLVTGTIFLYLCNLARTTGLYYTGKYHQGIFDFLHIYAGQTFTIIVSALFFIVWISIGENKRNTPE